MKRETARGTTLRSLRLALLVILLIAVTIIASAAPEDYYVPSRAQWSAPTEGPAVVMYILQHSVNDGAWINYATTTDTTVVIDLTYYDTHRVRVAGRDDEGNIGEWSEPSNYYSPIDSVPGPPGTPMTKSIQPFITDPDLGYDRSDYELHR